MHPITRHLLSTIPFDADTVAAIAGDPGATHDMRAALVGNVDLPRDAAVALWPTLQTADERNDYVAFRSDQWDAIVTDPALPANGTAIIAARGDDACLRALLTRRRALPATVRSALLGRLDLDDDLFGTIGRRMLETGKGMGVLAVLALYAPDRHPLVDVDLPRTARTLTTDDVVAVLATADTSDAKPWKVAPAAMLVINRWPDAIRWVVQSGAAAYAGAAARSLTLAGDEDTQMALVDTFADDLDTAWMLPSLAWNPVTTLRTRQRVVDAAAALMPAAEAAVTPDGNGSSLLDALGSLAGTLGRDVLGGPATWDAKAVKAICRRTDAQKHPWDAFAVALAATHDVADLSDVATRSIVADLFPTSVAPSWWAKEQTRTWAHHSGGMTVTAAVAAEISSRSGIDIQLPDRTDAPTRPAVKRTTATPAWCTDEVVAQVAAALTTAQAWTMFDTTIAASGDVDTALAVVAATR